MFKKSVSKKKGGADEQAAAAPAAEAVISVEDAVGEPEAETVVQPIEKVPPPPPPQPSSAPKPTAAAAPVEVVQGRKPASDSGEAARLRAENEALRGQVHMLTFKVELLLGMVTLANLDCDKLEDELQAADAK